MSATLLWSVLGLVLLATMAWVIVRLAASLAALARPCFSL
jgi:hypothetical protein